MGAIAYIADRCSYQNDHLFQRCWTAFTACQAIGFTLSIVSANFSSTKGTDLKSVNFLDAKSVPESRHPSRKLIVIILFMLTFVVQLSFSTSRKRGIALRSSINGLVRDIYIQGRDRNVFVKVISENGGDIPDDGEDFKTKIIPGDSILKIENEDYYMVNNYHKIPIPYAPIDFFRNRK